MRKGVSQLLALVLIVVMVLTISTFVYNWMSGYIRETTESPGNQSSEAVDCAKVAIKISNVYINTTNQSIKAVIKNEGFDVVYLKDVRVYDTSGNDCILNISSSNGLIGKGGIYNTKNTSCTVLAENCTDFDRVRASTTCAGVVDEFKYTTNEDFNNLICYR